MHFLSSSAAAQVQLPEFDSAQPIMVSAQAGNRWHEGVYEVWVLRGSCLIQQGKGFARCREAVLWIHRADVTELRPNQVIAYLEGEVEVASDRGAGATRMTDQTWLGRFESNAGVQVSPVKTAGKPDAMPPIYVRGMQRRSPEGDSPIFAARKLGQSPPYPEGDSPIFAARKLGQSPPYPEGDSPIFAARKLGQSPSSTGLNSPARQVQFAAPTPIPAPAPIAAEPPSARPCSARRLRVFSRSNVPMQFKVLPPDPSNNQWIAVMDGGVNVIVEDAQVEKLGKYSNLGTIDISADRLVIWTTASQEPNLQAPVTQDQRTPLEFYLEGNIVFRQGDRVISADRMYYDVPNEVGTVLNAELQTPAPNYEGMLRLHADVIQQTAQGRFTAQNAFITSSRMGGPGYRLQSGDLYFEDLQQPILDPATGQPAVDPVTGQQVFDNQRLATASNNFLFIGSVPVFYWPWMATDLTDSTFYIRRAQMKQDNVYGTQILTNWNGYQLLGIRNKPAGTDFDVSLDYLGKRGFGHGGSFTYDRPSIFEIPGHAAGLADFWGIQDYGLDNLGQGRMNLKPEKSYRYDLFWQHRQQLPYDLQLSAELGLISDRNFLEEYHKSQWDELKDQTTGLELKHLAENHSLSLSADYRINDFFTQTNWLPRADHFWMGQSLFRDAFTWYEHSNAAYAQLRELQSPKNPNDLPYNNLPWEANSRQGERLATRQEIDWPFQLGVVKVVPYAMGELARWGQDINGEPLDRIWGQAGVRASMPMWSVDPTIESDLLNVHGLAHKVVFDMEFSAAKANRHINELPLYDPLDDDSVEAFQRHFLTNTFGIPSYSPLPLPLGTPWPQLGTKFDERYYALRTGLQDWVASPSTEIADDLMAVRLGANQRWQTKRGPPSNRHIIDWMTLDTNITLFPNADRDNSGSVAGLLDYDYRWHVGDRLTLVSDGIFDFFDQGQKVISVGGFLTRPPRGSLYAGFRILEGPTNLNSQVLTLSYTYWMSPKWMSTYGTSIDFGYQRSCAQNFSITRIGESFLVNFGFTFDPARNTWGTTFAIEPRFLPKNRLGNVGGAQIPPAGVLGLE